MIGERVIFKSRRKHSDATVWVVLAVGGGSMDIQSERTGTILYCVHPGRLETIARKEPTP